jgi:hypothetical protein
VKGSFWPNSVGRQAHEWRQTAKADARVKQYRSFAADGPVSKRKLPIRY